MLFRSGEVEKNIKYKEIDEKFIKLMLAENGTIDSSVNVCLYFAWHYFYNNDLETSMKRFNQVWLLNPEYPDSYFGFAALLEMQKNNSEAERFYKIAESKDKSNERAKICFQRIADCKENLGDYNGTINAYLRLTKIDTTYSFAYKKLGFLYADKKNDTEKSLNAYNQAIKLDSIDELTFINRGYLYQTIKDYSKAISDYSKAIELDSKNIRAFFYRGITQMDVENFVEAKNDFETCVQLDDTSFELRRFLGISKLKLNDIEDACKDFQTAKNLGDKQVDILIKDNCN